MAASTVQVSKLGAAVVLFPGNTAVVVSKLGAAVILGYPDASCNVMKMNAYVVLAPIVTTTAGSVRRCNMSSGG